MTGVARKALLEAGAVIDHRFRIEQPLDSGTLAEVYRATDLSTHRSVALKVLLERPPPQHVLGRRVRRDLRALQRLAHRNVAHVHGVGKTDDGRLYLAMEYLDGETLRRHLRRQRILAVEDMLQIALQITEGLAAAHSAGVLHRDLKPENVFVSRSGQVKVADFGTARLLADVHGERGFGIGTPAYMAPERLIDDGPAFPEDGRSDLYSLGIIEYEMVAGYNPVLGEHKQLSRAEVSWRQAAVPPRVPVGVPLELWSVLEPTLRKEPDRRPSSVRDHLHQLQKVTARLAGQKGALPAAWAFAPARTPTELMIRRALRSVLTGAAVGAAGGVLVFIGWWIGAHQVGAARQAPERRIAATTPHPAGAPAPADSEASGRGAPRGSHRE